MEQVKRRPWRRWVVLVLMIAGFWLGGIFAPIQPEIAVAPEKLIEEPIIENFLGLGPLYLVNTLPTLVLTIILLGVIAYFTNRSLKRSAETDLVPRGIGNVMEAFLELLRRDSPKLSLQDLGRSWSCTTFGPRTKGGQLFLHHF